MLAMYKYVIVFLTYKLLKPSLIFWLIALAMFANILARLRWLVWEKHSGLFVRIVGDEETNVFTTSAPVRTEKNGFRKIVGYQRIPRIPERGEVRRMGLSGGLVTN